MPREDVSVQTLIDTAALDAAIASLEAADRPRVEASANSLPDELLERIFAMLGEFSVSAFVRATDGMDDPTRWWGENHVIPETRARERDLRQLRLVSRGWLHVSMPHYFRWTSLIPPKECLKPVWPTRECSIADHILDADQFSALMRARPPPRDPGGDPTLEQPYGHYVRHLALGHPNIHLKILRTVCEHLGELCPNLRHLHCFHMRGVPVLDLFYNKLPKLETLGEIIIPSDRPEVEREIRDDILFVLEHTPQIQRLAFKGGAFSSHVSQKFLTILTANRIFQTRPREPKASAGLTYLFFGAGSVVDVALLYGLPKAAQVLEGFAIDAGCQVIDQEELIPGFSLVGMVSKLRRLKRFEFVGSKRLPTLERDGPPNWAMCDQILQVGPQLEYLQLRADLLSYAFIRDLERTPGPRNLLHQRLRSLVIRYNVLPAEDLNFDDAVVLHSPRALRLFLASAIHFFENGIAYPTSPETVADLFTKLEWITAERQMRLDNGKERLELRVWPDGSASGRIVGVPESQRKKSPERSSGDYEVPAEEKERINYGVRLINGSDEGASDGRDPSPPSVDTGRSSTGTGFSIVPEKPTSCKGPLKQIIPKTSLDAVEQEGRRSEKARLEEEDEESNDDDVFHLASAT